MDQIDVSEANLYPYIPFVEHPGMNERTARAIAEKAIADTAAAFKLIKEDTLFPKIPREEIASAEAHRSNPVY